MCVNSIILDFPRIWKGESFQTDSSVPPAFGNRTVVERSFCYQLKNRNWKISKLQTSDFLSMSPRNSYLSLLPLISFHFQVHCFLAQSSEMFPIEPFLPHLLPCFTKPFQEESKLVTLCPRMVSILLTELENFLLFCQLTRPQTVYSNLLEDDGSNDSFRCVMGDKCEGLLEFLTTGALMCHL